MQALATLNPTLTRMVRTIDAGLARAVDPAGEAQAAAAAIAPFLGDATLLDPEHCASDPERYRAHIMYVDGAGRYSIVAVVWLPGQATAIHDHVSWCVVGVHQGAEHETQYRVATAGGDAYLVPVSTADSAAGSVSALLPPGDIHRVINAGRTTAISVHVYGADISILGSSIHRRYDDLPIRAG